MSENQRQAICYSNSQVQVGRPAPEKDLHQKRKGLNSCNSFSKFVLSIPVFTQKLNPHQFQLFPVKITIGQFFLSNL